MTTIIAITLDAVMETLVGFECYKELKESDDAIVQRQILIARWIFTNGFLNNDFPCNFRYIPDHVAQHLEEYDNY